MAEPPGQYAGSATADVGRLPVVSSEALLAGGRQLIIQHGSEQYRLLLTSNNKLILTK